LSLPKIYGVYLNNLSWYQIGNLYNECLKEGRAKYKIERINEMVEKLDKLPEHEIIQQYLFAGRISVNWYKLADKAENSILVIKQRLNAISHDILKKGHYLHLGDDFDFVHAIEKQNKLFITLGTGNYRDSISIQEYKLVQSPSEYFCTIIIREKNNIIEIRANETLRHHLLKTVVDKIGVKTVPGFGKKIITEEAFLAFWNAIPGAEIKRYKGKNLDPQSITELLEFTARQGVDYAQNTDEFIRMRENLQDLSLTFIFNYNDSTFPFRFNLLTGSLYFPSIVSEDAIDYIFDIYYKTIME